MFVQEHVRPRNESPEVVMNCQVKPICAYMEHLALDDVSRLTLPLDVGPLLLTSVPPYGQLGDVSTAFPQEARGHLSPRSEAPPRIGVAIRADFIGRDEPLQPGIAYKAYAICVHAGDYAGDRVAEA
ncbi:hypothetical protein [Nocardia salmonicida]